MLTESTECETTSLGERVVFAGYVEYTEVITGCALMPVHIVFVTVGPIQYI